MVGYKGKIYEVNSDFQVNSSSRGFSAVGSGKYFALGALSVLLENSVDPEEACLTSLGVAERLILMYVVHL